MYFPRESDAWQSFGVYVPCNMRHAIEDTIRLWAVQYDAWSQRCRFQAQHEAFVPLNLLHHLPGTFTDKSLVPNTICWTPSNEEAEEGHWTAASFGRLVLVGKAMDLHGVFSLQESTKSRTDLYRGLVDSTQDDNGVLIRVLDKSCRGRRSRKRSSSQPISMAHRRYDYSTAHKSDSHEWLPLVHYCVNSSAWVIRNHRCPRSCARYDDPQKDRQSRKRGFLYKARFCQAGYRRVRGMEKGPHDFTEGCPSGCGKVNFSAFAIPQSLPHWHPGRCGPSE